MRHVARVARPQLLVLGAALAILTPSAADARRLAFAETWENGRASWRTQLANGGDCKGWPDCGPAIQIRDQDANACSGKYLHIPRSQAGHDAANMEVTGGVTHFGIPYANAQFPVVNGDRLCVVAWIRAWDECPAKCLAGPYVGINYAGAHGVVDAGHNHCTHYMIGPPQWNGGPPQPDPEGGCTWRGGRKPPYGNMISIIADGQWHRYKNAFQVNGGDLVDWRLYSPELTSNTQWATGDKTIYGQPRLLLFNGTGTPGGAPPQNDADFGDILFFKAEAPAEDPCPTDAELDQLPYSSDHVVCPGGKICTTGVAALPAGDRTPAYPNNSVNFCAGCVSAFGAAPPGQGVCAETTPFCIGGGGVRGGTCKACGGDAASTADVATRCAADKPTCFFDGASVGSCGKCADDATCQAGDHPGPTCDGATGACFKCAADFGTGVANACPESAPRCDSASGLCGKCAWNDECAGPDHAGPNCHVPSGQCVTCAADFGGATAAPTTCLAEFPHCLTAPTDGEPAGACGRCTTSADCVNPDGKSVHAGTMCDPGTGACGRCDGDRGTSWTWYACQDEAMPTCHSDGNCGKCRSDADCANPPGQRLHAYAQCNAGTGVCEGLPADVPKCDGDNGRGTGAQCSDPHLAVCGADGMCNKCKSDADCLNPPGAKLHERAGCDLATGSCTVGAEAVVPPPPEDDLSMGCVCSTLPARTGRSALGAGGALLAGLLFALRRARRSARSSERLEPRA